MWSTKAILGLAVLGLASPFVRAQTPRVLFRDGDPILGVGEINRLHDLYINDAGSWLAFVEAEPVGQTSNTNDLCLIRNGFLTLREGMALPAPAGSTLADYSSLSLTSRGDMGMALKARAGAVIIDCLYWNLRALALKGDVLNLPPFAPTTTLESVRVVRLTPDGTLLTLCRVRNPNVSTLPNTDALLRFRLDAQGNVLQREVLATRGETLPVLGVPTELLGAPTSIEHSLALNRHGEFVLPVIGLGRRALLENLDTILAEEGQPAPVPGRTWNHSGFALSRVAINDRGDTAFTGGLTPIGGDNGEPTTLLIVKNGEKFVQSGDVIPAVSPATLAKGNSVLALSNRGDLFWRASPTSTSSGGAAFMRNYSPLIQEGVTVVEGNLVNLVSNADNGFAISPEGRFLTGRVVLQTLGDAVLYVDFGLISELPGCLGINQGTLRHLSGEPRVGQTIRVGMDDGPEPGSLPIFFFSRNSALGADGCGQIAPPLGELMLGLPFSSLFLLPAWDGVNPSELTIDVPANMALVDATFYAQGLFGNPNRPLSFRLTNALQFELGPP